MKKRQKLREYGFTLVEMLLVSTIVAAFLLMGANYIQTKLLATQIERASLQMQQILNAGLSYYVNNSKWPTDITTMQNEGYLPATPASLTSPWGTTYTAVADPPTGPPFLLFTVSISLPAGVKPGKAKDIVTLLAGKLPFGTFTTTSPYTVKASVNIPGQNLNNAPSVNFSSVYHNGACVPQPVCPVDASGNPSIPQIMVAPTAATGMNDALDPSPIKQVATYPITSITAYALSPAPGDTNPPNCTTTSTDPDCTLLTPAGTVYWRVCLQIVTTKGIVKLTDLDTPGATGPNYSADYATLMAVTRCSMQNEPAGSTFTTFGD